VPDLHAFKQLGFPLKQTVRVSLTESQTSGRNLKKKIEGAGSAISNSGAASARRIISSEDPNKLYSFVSLPLMESAVGEGPAQEMLDSIVADEANDYGCICEIDLSKKRKINKILSQLLFPQKDKTDAPKKQPTGLTSLQSSETADLVKGSVILEEDEESKTPHQQSAQTAGGFEETKTTMMIQTSGAGAFDTALMLG